MSSDPADQTDRKSSLLKTVLLYILKAGIAAGLILWLVLRDRQELMTTLSRLPWWVLPSTFLAVFIQMTLTAWRWNRLLQVRGFQVTQWTTFVLTFEGAFANLFLPAGAVGGDVIKAGLISVRMPKGSKIEAALSIFVDRLLGLYGLYGPAFLVFLLLLPEFFRYPHLLRILSLVAGGAGAAGLTAATMLFFPDLIFKVPFLARFIRFLDSKLKNALTRAIDSVSIYRKYWKTVFRLSLLSAFVIQPLLVLAVFLPMAASAEKLPNPGRIYAAAIYSNTISTIPATPGGMGTREESLREFLHFWGAEKGIASSAAIVYLAAILLNYMIGGVFFLLPVLSTKERK